MDEAIQLEAEIETVILPEIRTLESQVCTLRDDVLAAKRMVARKRDQLTALEAAMNELTHRTRSQSLIVRMMNTATELASAEKGLHFTFEAVFRELRECFFITNNTGSNVFTVFNLEIPCPGLWHILPIEHINAGITSFCHCLMLVASYLRIDLPFKVRLAGLHSCIFG